MHGLTMRVSKGNLELILHIHEARTIPGIAIIIRTQNRDYIKIGASSTQGAAAIATVMGGDGVVRQLLSESIMNLCSLDNGTQEKEDLNISYDFAKASFVTGSWIPSICLSILPFVHLQRDSNFVIAPKTMKIRKS
ncbi:hypothetical protein VNO77_44001 [Canavalia gladiata]|uniref:Uncharacterized protein n=1 Tax=Canavalia gladiata TaxID=3824 RepID=A0AAN9PPY8_CANGL